jgi:hypothetical protein
VECIKRDSICSVVLKFRAVRLKRSYHEGEGIM